MHFLVHEGGNGNDYKCGMCNQFFMEPGLMRKHVRTFHISEKEYKCDPCDKVFPILVDFKIHKNKVHKGYKYKCNLCDRLYSNPEVLQKHISDNHEGNNENGKNYECAICNHLFVEKSSLRKHVKKFHQNDVKPKCKPCDQTFATPGALKHHLGRYHEGSSFFKDSIIDFLKIHLLHTISIKI